MQRLETRHWCIIGIVTITVCAMITHTPINDLKEVYGGLGLGAMTDFVLKRKTESKTPTKTP